MEEKKESTKPMITGETAEELDNVFDTKEKESEEK